MREFDYIIDKIQRAEFQQHPFPHLYIEDFLSDDHLHRVITDRQIRLPAARTTERLIDDLHNLGYSPIQFPGCTTSVTEYLRWINGGGIGDLYNKDIVEASGMAFRLDRVQSPHIQNIQSFLNSPPFHDTLERKFALRDTRLSTTIQKYLTGYEISPHPDVRSKALTFLVNINTETHMEHEDIHTHLLSFRDRYEKVSELWEKDQTMDRCWVPWDWCETHKLISKNNSLVMFAPGNRSLHAIKLDYDHLLCQRTQFYGNLWFNRSPKSAPAYYKELQI